MTIRLYYNKNDTFLDTELISCVYDEEKALYKTLLKETILHPKGGGQDQDMGYINGHKILEITTEGNDFYYYIDAHLEEKTIVTMEIDSELRILNSRRHSLGHIIGYVLEQKNWIPIKASHYPNDCKVIFKQTENSVLEIDIEALTLEIKNLLDKDYEKTIYYESNKRIISFDGKATYMCGGTHVSRLKEIGSFTIEKAKIKKDNLTISYSIS